MLEILLGILSLVFAGFFFFLGFMILDKSTDRESCSATLGTCFVAAVFVAIGSFAIVGPLAYRQGQIDAISGEIYYELVEEKTETWREKK